MGAVKRSRALHHLSELADSCARLADSPIHPLRVVELWAFGDILDPAADPETVHIALVVDLPEVPWLTTPPGATHWAASSRLSRSPFTPYWRSTSLEVWNHRIVRPALVWNERANGVEAIANGTPTRVYPPSRDALDSLLADEVALSLKALRATTAAYADQRWKPGKLDPHSDALHEAAAGYLDLLDATAGS